MSAVVCEIELFIPGAASLKAKRHVVKSIIGRIKSRCNASAAETGYQDSWQRSIITAAIAGAEHVILQKQIELIRQIVYDNAEAELVDITTEYL